MKKKKEKESSFWGKIIKVPYYYVPPCPSCGSKMTGRYVKMHREVDDNYILETSLKNGEIISMQPEVPAHNLFCAECGFEWTGDVEASMISLDEQKKERLARHTDEMLGEAIDDSRESNAESRKKPFYHLRRFVGKL